MHKPLALPLEPAPWWTLFDVTREELRAAAGHILRLYRRTSSPSTHVHERHRGLIQLATKAGIRAWLEQRS